MKKYIFPFRKQKRYLSINYKKAQSRYVLLSSASSGLPEPSISWVLKSVPMLLSGKLPEDQNYWCDMAGCLEMFGVCNTKEVHLLFSFRTLNLNKVRDWTATRTAHHHLNKGLLSRYLLGAKLCVCFQKGKGQQTPMVKECTSM